MGSLNVYEFGLNSGTQMEIGFMLSHSPDAQGMGQEYLKKTNVFWRRLKSPRNHYLASVYKESLYLPHRLKED